VDAEQFESQVLSNLVPTMTELQSKGLDTLATLTQFLNGLKKGLDLSVYGFPVLTKDQKNRLIRTIVALITFLSNLKEGSSTTTLASAFTGIVVNVFDPDELLDRTTKLFNEMVTHIEEICNSFMEGLKEGFQSQSGFSVSEVLASLFLSGKNIKTKLDKVLQDRLMVVVQSFMTKIVSFWVASTKLVQFDEINMESINDLCATSYKLIGDGVDIIDMLVSSLRCVTENWTDLLHGKFESLLLGKTESSKFENTCASIEGMYKMVKARQTDLLKENYGHTMESFTQQVTDTLTLGRNYVKTQTGAPLAVLKAAVTRLECIKAEMLLAIQRESLKPEPLGILLYGGSKVGKSTISEQIGKTIIAAHGIPYADGMINAVNYRDKFDSTTTSDSRITIADDVGNAESREDLSERVIDHINMQRRPINKAAVDDKGVHFYNNVGHVASTNDHRMKNVIRSTCPESVYRRFKYHVHVMAKKQYRRVPNNPDSGFDTDKTENLTRAEKLDAYEFEVFEFIAMQTEPDESDGEGEDIINNPALANIEVHDGMVLRRCKLPDTDMPILERFKAFIFKATQAHHALALDNLKMMKDQASSTTCMDCGVSTVYCQCKKEMESQMNIVGPIVNWYGDVSTMTNARLASAHAEMSQCLSSYNPLPTIRLLYRRVEVASYMYTNRSELVQTARSHVVRAVMLMMWIILAVCMAVHVERGFLCVVNVICLFVYPCAYLTRVARQEMERIENELCSRPGILTYLVPSSEFLRSEKAKKTFKWMAAVGGFYAVYRMFRKNYEGQDKVYTDETSNVPSTKWEYTKDKQNQAPSMCREAHTTTGRDLTEKVAENMTTVVMKGNGIKAHSTAMSVYGNYYIVSTHILPTEGSYDLEFYPNGVENFSGFAKVKDVQPSDLSEMVGTDCTIVRVVQSAPRWDVSKHLPLEHFSSRVGTLVTKKAGVVNTEQVNCYRNTKLGKPAAVTTTTGAVITAAYKAELSRTTEKGMCGSVYVDLSRGVILGFHAAGNQRTAVFSCVTKQDVDAAMEKFDHKFQPTSQTEIDIGHEQGYSLVQGDRWMSCEVEQAEYNLPVSKHTWINQGIVCKNGLPQEEFPQHPFCKSDYLQDINEQFGPTQYGPPQEMSADYHKKKAALDYNTPKMDFSSKDVERAMRDFLDPIRDKIRTLKETDPDLFKELGRELSVQEALDGIGEQGLTGINNSSSAGWPYNKAKSKFMIKDTLDPNIPKMPREFDEDLYPLTERLTRARECAKRGERCNFIVKTCSKGNELLPSSKKKCRPFQAMGLDALILFRQTMSPMVRFFGRNKFLTECMLGINLKSHEAKMLRDHLTYFNEENCIAGDFKAYDRNMSSMMTSAVAEIILTILADFGYTKEQLKVANGLLTEIVYPHMNFYGQLCTLANSNPSGQPLTTHVNSIANSLYTRIIFYALCPEEEDFRSGVKLATYGDDNAMNVADRLKGLFTHTKMSELYMERYGMTYTMDKKDAESVPYQHFEELGFLKQRIVFNNEYDAYVPLLDETSITKSLHWQKKANECPDPANVQFMQKVDAGLREASHYGKEYYDNFANKIRAIKQANCAALQALKVPTYEQMVTKFFYAFHPELQAIEEEEPIFESQSSSVPTGDITRKLESVCNGIMITGIIIFKVAEAWVSAQQPKVVYSNNDPWVPERYAEDELMDEILAEQEEELLFESQSYIEPVSNKLFAWKAGHLVGHLSSGICVWTMLPLKLIIDKLPTWAGFLVGLGSESTLIMEANKLLAQSAAVEAGRFDAIEVDSKEEYLTALITLQHALELSKIHVYSNAMPGVYAAHKKVCDAISRVTLTKHTLPVREAPFTILLSGGTGMGKTNLAITLAKQVLEVLGHPISSADSSIVVLNETDSFQSEYTSDTAAVIFDDVANDVSVQEKENPLRKLLDFSNNISKMALSPEAEKKGIVVIRPKVVIVTTNAVGICKNEGWHAPVSTDLSVTDWSVAPAAYLRRFNMALHVTPRCFHKDKHGNETHKINWETDGPNFWRFAEMRYRLTNPFSAEKVPGDKYESVEEILQLATTKAVDHQKSQSQFIDRVLNDLDSELCEHNLIPSYCSTCEADKESLFESQAEIAPEEEPAEPQVAQWSEVNPVLKFYRSVEIYGTRLTHPGILEPGLIPKKKARTMRSTHFYITQEPLIGYASTYADISIMLEWFDIVEIYQIAYVSNGKVYKMVKKDMESFGVEHVLLMINPSSSLMRH